MTNNWLAGAKAVAAAALLVSAPALAECNLGVMADLPVTMDGSRASVPARINGKDTRFWLDSGAFFSIMPQAKANELGLSTEPLPVGFYVEGIGGAATVALAKIKAFGIVGQTLKNIEFLVGGTDAGNGLIGRNILAMRDTEFDLADGSVKLIDPHNCRNTNMAYWAANKPYFTASLSTETDMIGHLFELPVTVNGIKLKAVLDTGADTSGLSRSAAKRAGIDLTAPDVLRMEVRGVGRHIAKGWVVPVANVTIGDEQILRTRIDVYDDSGINGGSLPDMLLGADYIMAHHIYVARSQNLIYFTYTGGKPFYTSREVAAPAPATAATGRAALPAGTRLIEAVASSFGEPKTAEALARRGAARITGRNFTGAIADLSEAIRQSPGTAAFYADRAKAYALAENSAAESADIDQALTLDPTNGEVLRLRAAKRLANNDRAGALTDAEAAARVTPPGSLDNGELAGLFVRLRQPGRAIPMYTAMIAAHHDDSGLDEMLNGRCWARALANIDLDKALIDCNRAIRHDGSRGDWIDSRGLVYFRLANYPLAIADYDAALKIFPKMAWSLYMRGQARIALDQKTAGNADQAAAVAIDPNIADAAAGYGIAKGAGG